MRISVSRLELNMETHLIILVVSVLSLVGGQGYYQLWSPMGRSSRSTLPYPQIGRPSRSPQFPGGPMDGGPGSFPTFPALGGSNVAEQTSNANAGAGGTAISSGESTANFAGGDGGGFGGSNVAQQTSNANAGEGGVAIATGSSTANMAGGGGGGGGEFTDFPAGFPFGPGFPFGGGGAGGFGGSNVAQQSSNTVAGGDGFGAPGVAAGAVMPPAEEEEPEGEQEVCEVPFEEEKPQKEDEEEEEGKEGKEKGKEEEKEKEEKEDEEEKQDTKEKKKKD